MDQIYLADFSLLPAHIITKILVHLQLDDFKNASTVCKSWNYASTDPKITRKLLLQPNEKEFREICKTSRRKYGVLKIRFIKFDKKDSYYFELFEKLCPFVHELQIIYSGLTIYHFLKLLELTTCLETISLVGGSAHLDMSPGLFPVDYDCEAKKRIVKNISTVKAVSFEDFINIPLIADLLQCTINFNKFKFVNGLQQFNWLDDEYPFLEWYKIFHIDNVGNLEHLHLNLNCYVYADDFILRFVEIKNLNLKSFRLIIRWHWKNRIYNSLLFRQFIIKIQNLVELSLYFMVPDQLSLICEHMKSVKRLNCTLNKNNQPISELTKLKQLQELELTNALDAVTTPLDLIEIDKFFNYKFEYLRVFNFHEFFITEPNLNLLCEHHPNLIELKLTRLLTRNLEIIFKHLTKLRFVSIYFGFSMMSPEIREYLKDLLPICDLDREYEYKISRLHDLEKFHLSELVHGIHEEDVVELKHLWLTNLPKLFRMKKKQKLIKL